MDQDIMELRRKGYCCSQIIMEMGLRKMERPNPDMIAATAGLCNGFWQGKTCGIYSACICLLCLADAEEADRFNTGAFSDWFEDSFGTVSCGILLDHDEANREERCPPMLEASLAKIGELLDWE